MVSDAVGDDAQQDEDHAHEGAEMSGRLGRAEPVGMAARRDCIEVSDDVGEPGENETGQSGLRNGGPAIELRPRLYR